jgi:hypothetical protein
MSCEDSDGLFQVYMMENNFMNINNNWTPLVCRSSNPNNCGPTALNLINVISRDEAQAISNFTEEIGVHKLQLNEMILKNIPEVKNISSSFDKPIGELYNFLNNRLNNNYATIIGLKPNNSIGHLVAVAKYNEILTILEGQRNQFFSGRENIEQYLLNFNYFIWWCTNKNINKRKIVETTSILRKQTTDHLSKKKKNGW